MFCRTHGAAAGGGGGRGGVAAEGAGAAGEAAADVARVDETFLYFITISYFALFSRYVYLAIIIISLITICQSCGA